MMIMFTKLVVLKSDGCMNVQLLCMEWGELKFLWPRSRALV